MEDFFTHDWHHEPGWSGRRCIDCGDSEPEYPSECRKCPGRSESFCNGLCSAVVLTALGVFVILLFLFFVK